jgi:hypothetical protein
MWQEVFPVALESIQIQGREIIRNLNTRNFKANVGWSKRMMCSNVVIADATHYVSATTPKAVRRKFTVLSAPHYKAKEKNMFDLYI